MTNDLQRLAEAGFIGLGMGVGLVIGVGVIRFLRRFEGDKDPNRPRRDRGDQE